MREELLPETAWRKAALFLCGELNYGDPCKQDNHSEHFLSAYCIAGVELNAAYLAELATGLAVASISFLQMSRQAL